MTPDRTKAIAARAEAAGEPVSLWRAIPPSLRVGAVIGAAALAVVALKGVPAFPSAHAKAAAAYRQTVACVNCRSGPPPFRMLPSDLESGGTSTHAISRRSSQLPRREAGQ